MGGHLDEPVGDPGLTRPAQHGRVDQTPAHQYDSAQPYDGIPDREIESLPEFDEVIATVGTLARYRVQAVDLTTRT